MEYLRQWQDKNKYGVWLDNKPFENKDLAAKKPADFGWYHVSKLLKNSKNYGKYQFEVHLYSIAHFDKHMRKKE